MQFKPKSCLLSVLFIAGNVMLINSSVAQSLGNIDPPRWTTEDRTPQARYQTSKKEAAAAFREAQAACRQVSGGERASCMREARENYQADLDEAKRRLQE